jgi:arginase family enzyme
MDYIVPGLLGFLVGAVIYGLTYDQVFPAISAIANYGNTTMPDLWNVSPFLTILLFGLMSLLLFYLIDRVGWQRKEKGE